MRQSRDVNSPIVDHHSHSINTAGVRVFIALNLTGGVGLLIVLLTAILSRKIKRLPTWYSFCVSWIFSSLAYSLLTLGGQQMTAEPNRQLCLVQAAFMYAVPPLTSCTTLSLLLQILLSFPGTEQGPRTKKGFLALCLLLFGPYLIFLIVVVGVTLFERENPSTLQKAPRGTYCDLTTPAWQRVAFVVVAIVSTIIIMFQSHLVYQLYLNPQVLRRKTHSIATMLRGLLFTVLGAITVIIALVLIIADDQNLALDIILSIFPVFALIIFGTQKDLLQVWLPSRILPERSKGEWLSRIGKPTSIAP